MNVYVVTSGDIESGRVRGVFFESATAMLVMKCLARREWDGSRRHGRPCYRRHEKRYPLVKMLADPGPTWFGPKSLGGYTCNKDWWSVHEWRVM